eukprot:m.179553 g.179553  ORF g.179553 m.179553 type:complete len:301 (-) comp10459_c1_seq15:618-1520(-)
MESAGRVCAQDNQSPPLCTGQLAAMDADVLAAAFPPVPEEPVPAAAALDGGPLFTTIASNLEGGFAPFRFKRSMMELLLFAQLGIAIAAHEQDATPRSTANHSTVSSMRASPVPSSLGDAASGSGDSTASDVDEDVEALSLPPVSPAGALDLLNDQIFESLRQGGGDVLGTLTRTGGRGVDGLLTAGSLVGRASSRVVTGGATLFSQLGRLVPRRTDRAAQAAQAMGNGFLFGIEVCTNGDAGGGNGVATVELPLTIQSDHHTACWRCCCNAVSCRSCCDESRQAGPRRGGSATQETCRS